MKNKFFLFPYSSLHYLAHPWLFAEDFLRNVKFGIQRFFRGWDDSAPWSVDIWLCDLIPEIIGQLREHTHGIPAEIYEKYPDNEELANDEWGKILLAIIDGFSSGKKITEMDYDNEEERASLYTTWETGMNLFKKHFFNLWD